MSQKESLEEQLENIFNWTKMKLQYVKMSEMQLKQCLGKFTVLKA